MGVGSSIDKAVGGLINTTTKGAKTVLNDQRKERQDFFKHPWTMIVPTIIGVICVVASFVVLFTTCKNDPKDPHSSICDGAFGILLTVGLVLIIGVQIVLAVRHPNAAAEMAVGGEIKNLFSS